MSFLHLMEWHAEVRKKLDRWEREVDINQNSDSGEDGRKRRKIIPFIVVANKLDLLGDEFNNAQNVQPSVRQQRRSVMGFSREYRGRELKYEYTAEKRAQTAEKRNKNHDNHCARASRIRIAELNCPPAKQLSYSLRETLWWTDQSYLNALQNTEDELSANRHLILHWCQRNGIPHVEASALDGRGVGEAMEHLIRIGVEEQQVRFQEFAKFESKNDRETPGIHGRDLSQKKDDMGRISETDCVLPRSKVGMAQHEGTNNHPKQKHFVTNDGTEGNAVRDVKTVDQSQYYFLYHRTQNNKLDLFARYSPKEEQGCSPFKCWLPLFPYCHE